MITNVGSEELYNFTKTAEQLTPEDIVALQQLGIQQPAPPPAPTPDPLEMALLGGVAGAGAGTLLENLRPTSLFNSKNYLPMALAGSLLGGSGLYSLYN